MKFPCKACGECCRHVLAPLDRGDGVCRHYDTETRLCSVYDARPFACNVDQMFVERLQGTLSATVFYMAQAAGCTALHPENADMPMRTETALREAGLFTEGEVVDIHAVYGQLMDKLTADDFLVAGDG
jgi:Fe-S-cluster containining protein